MDLKMFDNFQKECSKNLAGSVDEIFQKNNFRREDVLFFATMADGDYIEEMLEASIKMFNLPETIEAFGVKNDLP